MHGGILPQNQAKKQCFPSQINFGRQKKAAENSAFINLQWRNSFTHLYCSAPSQFHLGESCQYIYDSTYCDRAMAELTCHFFLKLQHFTILVPVDSWSRSAICLPSFVFLHTPSHQAAARALSSLDQTSAELGHTYLSQCNNQRSSKSSVTSQLNKTNILPQLLRYR